MIAALGSITLRALLNRRRTVLLLLLGALLVVITVLFRLGDPSNAESTEVTRRLLADFGIAVLLPLVAVIIGTSALGSEIEDGTIVYLLAKPVPRWLIVLVKLVVAWLVTTALVAPAIVLAGLIGGYGQLAAAHAVAAVIGALEYTAIFIALSLVTSRALIAGLAYVVVWEGVVAGLFSGTRIFSIRQHALAVAEALGGPGAADSAELALGVALAAAAVATAAAVMLAIGRLATVELRGET